MRQVKVEIIQKIVKGKEIGFTSTRSFQREALNTQHSTRSIQREAFNTQHSTPKPFNAKHLMAPPFHVDY